MKDKDVLFKINKKIVYTVIVFHVLLILSLSIHFSPKKFKNKSIVVNTINVKNVTTKVSNQKMPPAKKIIAINTQKNIKAESQNNKLKSLKEENKKAIKEEKKPQINKTVKKNTVVEQKKISKVQKQPLSNDFEKLVDKLEKQVESFDKSKTNTHSSTELLVPKPITKINIDKVINSKFEIETTENASVGSNDDDDSDYKSLFIRELQNYLKLPEYGEVKIKFLIDPNGKISEIEVLEYQSYENQNYLKNRLSELSFESMNKLFDKPKKYIVIFKNE
ncbi:MAG: hypothetical protein WC688_00080 [Parachlamydiales bacterium]|jgi:outer membrane biosynthesis protein TonB